jgi:Ca2+:H+ antiporter
MEKTHSGSRSPTLPTHNGEVNGEVNGQGKKITPGIRAEGESGRRGFHPLKFLHINVRSSSKVSAAVNILWPFVPVAIACRYALPESPNKALIVFILSYIAMVPCANMIGFAGQELARKFAHTWGVLIETT